MQCRVAESEAYQTPNSHPLSDKDYEEELARLVQIQKQLYYALPVQYKTMADEKYEKHMEVNGENDWPREADKDENLMPHSLAVSDEMLLLLLSFHLEFHKYSIFSF